MNVQAIILMSVLLLTCWGGFVFFLIFAAKTEQKKQIINEDKVEKKRI